MKTLEQAVEYLKAEINLGIVTDAVIHGIKLSICNIYDIEFDKLHNML